MRRCIISALAVFAVFAAAPVFGQALIFGEYVAEYQKLKNGGDEAALNALVEKVAKGFLEEKIAFLGPRKALFPEEIKRLTEQTQSMAGLVLSQGNKPNVNSQRAALGQIDVRVAGLAAFVSYDFRFIELSNRISALKMMSYGLEKGFLTNAAKNIKELMTQRENLLYSVSSPLMDLEGDDRLDGLKALDEVMNAESAVLADAAKNRTERITAVLRLRTAFQGLRTVGKDPGLAKLYKTGSDAEVRLSALSAKAKPYLASLGGIVKTKGVDPELQLAAACAWIELESGSMTKAQRDECSADKFQGVKVPELSRYAEMHR